MTDCLLRTALGVNCAFSSLTGLLLTFAPRTVAGWIGYQNPVGLQVVGVGLLAFAVLLLYLAMLARHPQLLSMLASLGDFTWVGVTIGLAVVAPAMFSTNGWLIVAVVAVVVTACGLFQAIGIDRTYRCHAAERAGWLRLCLEYELDVAPHDFWVVLRDVGEIHRYAPSIANVSIVEAGTEEGHPVRECQDAGGRCWREEFSIDDARMRVDLRFQADRPGFPYPFTQMEGCWDLESMPRGAKLRVWWNVVLERRWAAFVLMPLFSFVLQGSFLTTVENMCAAAIEGDERRSPAADKKLVIAVIC